MGASVFAGMCWWAVHLLMRTNARCHARVISRKYVAVGRGGDECF